MTRVTDCEMDSPARPIRAKNANAPATALAGLVSSTVPRGVSHSKACVATYTMNTAIRARLGSRSVETTATAIKEGIHVGDKTKMKAFPDLSADDNKALVAYVRSLKK